MIKEELESRAREYLAEHSEYSEVFGQTFVAVDTLTAMVDFAEQETKELEKENTELEETLGKCAKMPVLYCLGAKETINKAKEIIRDFLSVAIDYIDPIDKNYSLIAEAEQFLSEVGK